MRERLVAAWVATTFLCIVGCSESAMVRSYPPGAKLYVNDHFEGIAPIIYTTPHSQIGKNFRVRLEREGYTTLEGTLRKQICGGRIAGGIFTLGIVLLVRGPTCFVSPQDFSLTAVQPDARRSRVLSVLQHPLQPGAPRDRRELRDLHLQPQLRLGGPILAAGTRVRVLKVGSSAIQFQSDDGSDVRDRIESGPDQWR
jgi:hypothetical protein